MRTFNAVIVSLFFLSGCLRGTGDRAMFETGQKCLHDEKYERAINIFEKIIDIYPASFWTNASLLSMGYAWEDLKQKEKALRCYKKVIEMNFNPYLAKEAKRAIDEIDKVKEVVKR